MAAVPASGTRSMSLSSMVWKPLMLEPSKPVPSANNSSVSSLMGSDRCCKVPGRSVNFRSTIWTLLSSASCIASDGVSLLSAML